MKIFYRLAFFERQKPTYRYSAPTPGAFEHCSSLTSLVLPETLRYVGTKAFHDCPRLEGPLRLPKQQKVVVGPKAFPEELKCLGCFVFFWILGNYISGSVFFGVSKNVFFFFFF